MVKYKYQKHTKKFGGQLYELVKEYKLKSVADKKANALRKKGNRIRCIKVIHGYAEYYAVYKRKMTVGQTRARREKKFW